MEHRGGILLGIKIRIELRLSNSNGGIFPVSDGALAVGVPHQKADFLSYWPMNACRIEKRFDNDFASKSHEE